MRAFAITLVLVGIAFAAAPAEAQSPQTSYTLASKQDGGLFVWTAEGLSGDNPTLFVPANTEITLTAKGDASEVPHNIKVGSNAASETVQGEGSAVQYSFTSPASGSVEYVCTIHPTTMKGKMTTSADDDELEGVASAAPEPTNEPTNSTPGAAVAGIGLAFLGAALLVSRRRA